MRSGQRCVVLAEGADAGRTPVMAGPQTKQRWVYAPREAKRTKRRTKGRHMHEREACVIGQVVDAKDNTRD